MSTPDSPTSPFNVERIGKLITAYRELSGLSVAALAQRAGIAASYVYKLERGVAENPGLVTLDAVARALDITIYDLLTAAGHDLSVRGAELQDSVSVVEHLVAQGPEELRALLDELEAKEGPVDLDVIRTLAVIQMRGKRPRTLEDWRFAYESLKRAVR